MSIKVNMHLPVTETPVELNAENFPRLFYNGKQVRDISIVYGDNCIDIQHVILSNDLLARSVNTWIDAEKIRLNKELAEITRKLEILNSVKES